MAATSRTSYVLRSARVVLLALLAGAACGTPGAESTGTSTDAITGSLVISGEINDANGLPLSGAKVFLFGPSDRNEPHDEADDDDFDGALAVTTTGADGTYSFTRLRPGSYFVRPHLRRCLFDPSGADLDNVSTNVTANFAGAGLGCGGEPTVNFGATQGPLTISGHVRDGSGNAVVGARIVLHHHLHHAVDAVRFSDLTGGYSFRVFPGAFELTATAECSLDPSDKKLRHVTANVIQDFMAVSSGCTLSTVMNQNPTGTAFGLSQDGQSLGATYVNIEQRLTAADARSRLKQIVSEQSTPSMSLTIDGSPAIERQMENPNDDLPEDQELSGGGVQALQATLLLTDAIAADTILVRFESHISTANTATLGTLIQAGRSFNSGLIPILHGLNYPPILLGPIFSPVSGTVSAGPLLTSTLVANSDGELEIAASDAKTPVVVYGTPNAAYFSLDGGQTVTPSSIGFVVPPTAATSRLLGDPSIAVGAPNAAGAQNFWYSIPEQSGQTPSGGLITAIALYKSTDNGKTFAGAPNAFPVNCNSMNSPCTITDQPLLAVDRVHQAVDSSGVRHDIVYLVWRQPFAVGCSADEKTWNVDFTTFAISGADNGRPTVAPDGSLLVAYKVLDGNSNTYRVWVHKFSSCAGPNPFQPQTAAGFPVEVPLPPGASQLTPVSDLVGLDRAPFSNHAIAADPDPSTGRVFVTYANETSPTSDDVHVAEATGLGSTWVSDVVVNRSSRGNRFFPWVCTTAGTTFVTWYDRRDATSARPDLTAYYRSSVVDNGSGLVRGEEVNVSGVDDPECISGFPSAARGSVEEQGCTSDLPGSPANPINAGKCIDSAGNAGAPCDQRFPNCPSGSTCGPGGGGQPKYGDYNGNACAGGQLFMAWASSTPPSGLQCTAVGLPCSAPTDCCSGTTCAGAVCAPTSFSPPPGIACVTSSGLFCASNVSCCSGVCTSSQCSCLANGAACPAGTGCCSGNCEAGQCLPAIEIYANSSSACQGTVCQQGQTCTAGGCCDGPSACGQVCCAAPVPACAGGTCCTTQGACGTAGCCDPGVCVHTTTGPTCCAVQNTCGTECCATPGDCVTAVPLLGRTCGCNAPDVVCRNTSPDGTVTTECCENDAAVHYTCMTFEPGLNGGGGNHCCDEAHACGSVCCPFQDTCVVGPTGPQCSSSTGIQ